MNIDNEHGHTVGELVHVFAFGSWRPGVITRIAGTQVWVHHVRNRSGDTHEQPFTAGEVLPADGVQLAAVRDLRPGHVVLVAGEAKTVQTLRPVPSHRTRQVRVRYGDGDEVDLSAKTLLRVAAVSGGGR